MNEDLFFKIVISILIIGFIINFIQDYYTNKFIKEKLAETSKSISNLWGQISRIDDEFKNIKSIIDIDFNKLNELIKNKNDLLKNDILFFNDKIDKEKFSQDILVNRINSHAKKIAYIKKVLDKLFDHKVEVRHKAKLVKLEGELDKW